MGYRRPGSVGLEVAGPFAQISDGYFYIGRVCRNVVPFRHPVCLFPPIDSGTLNLQATAQPGVTNVDAGPLTTALTVSADQLTAIVPGLKNATAVSGRMNTAISDAGLTTMIGVSMFIAQVAHESDRFKKLEEDGGKTVYNKKTKTQSSYKKYRDTKESLRNKDDEAFDYFFFMYDKESPAENRQKVAKDLGNTEAGDGVKFRGRGYIQITGRTNYSNAGTALNLTLVESPDLASDPTNAARIAGWFWKSHGCNTHANTNTVAAFTKVTKIINGGTNGLEDRKTLWTAAKTALGVKD